MYSLITVTTVGQITRPKMGKHTKKSTELYSRGFPIECLDICSLSQKVNAALLAQWLVFYWMIKPAMFMLFFPATTTIIGKCM